jgi:hypothetical protein
MAAENTSGPPQPPSGAHVPNIVDEHVTIIKTGGSDQGIAPADAQQSQGRP